ncbi:Kunitz/Bovine pancreatic trypsin inhibitor domain protein [Ancylostoma caninum]|uniref:Kunitz/Bovine pancreatic trypsin inhibitor domain protein n=1 Tax=Ancylostoma caninum TaxID=29170 RepID=A0A368GWV6_ANCCA|nr:Kunitz/Bovine pancreatic trypsin inhibitor domain protein [Ancylostoma caninum]
MKLLALFLLCLLTATGTMQAMQARCRLPVDEGRPCKKRKGGIRWTFYRPRYICTRMFYRGCDGNKNRFKTEQECKKACRPFNNNI